MTTILFVCSGNTCRSPMAACLFNARAKAAGWDDVQAISAGVGALSGDFATGGAQRAMERRGLSLRQHRSQPVTKRLLLDVSAVCCMTNAHEESLRRSFPGAAKELLAFDPPVPDPYGGDDERYEQTAKALEKHIDALMIKLGRAKE